MPPLGTYAGISVMIAGATALGLLVRGVLYPANLDALFLLVVFVSALKWGRGPALFAASAGAVAGLERNAELLAR
jgi:two-component system, OmpR family, sensor histidine kinase KdpD